MTTINDLKISIPQLRKIMPSLIASDIVGVQPMTGPSGSIFSMNSRYFTAILIDKIGEWDSIIGTEFCYYVITNIDSMRDEHPKLLEAITWCESALKDRYHCVIDQDDFHRFYFKKEQDRTLFLLAFG